MDLIELMISDNISRTHTKPGLAPGIIIVIAVASLVVLSLLIIFLFCCLYSRKQKEILVPLVPVLKTPLPSPSFEKFYQPELQAPEIGEDDEEGQLIMMEGEQPYFVPKHRSDVSIDK